MGYLMVSLEQQHGINAVGSKLWIVRLAEDRLYVVQLLFFRALVNVLNCFRIDVHSIYRARAGNAASSAHREPTGSGSDVGNALSWLDAKHIHYAVDLQALIAPPMPRRWTDHQYKECWSFVAKTVLRNRAGPELAPRSLTIVLRSVPA